MSPLTLSFKSLDLSQAHLSIAAKKSAQEAMRHGFGKLVKSTEHVTAYSNPQGLWDMK